MSSNTNKSLGSFAHKFQADKHCITKSKCRAYVFCGIGIALTSMSFTFLLSGQNTFFETNRAHAQDTASYRLRSTNADQLNEIVNIPDANLNRGFHEVLNKQDLDSPITRAEMLKVKSLSPEVCKAHDSSEGSVKVANFEGIQFAENLSWLSMVNQRTNDLSLLAGLKKLEHLDLRGIVSEKGEAITDLSPLSKLKALKYLNLRQAKPYSAQALSGLTNLETLELQGNQLTDSSFLKNLKKLKHLEADYNRFSEINGLENSTNLEYLNLSTYSRGQIGQEYPHISSLDPIKNNLKLKTLAIANQNIQDITALKNLKNLERLDLQGNNIENFEVLLSLENITQIWLSGNPRNLGNNIDDFKTAQKLAKILEKQNFAKADLSALEAIINAPDDQKNFFSDETLKEIKHIITELDSNDAVANNNLSQFKKQDKKKKINKIVDLKGINTEEQGKVVINQLQTKEQLLALLPNKLTVELVSEQNDSKPAGRIEKTAKGNVLHVAIVDEQDKLIKQPISFSLNGNKPVSKDGYLNIDVSEMGGLTWDYNKVLLDPSLKNYILIKGFNYTKYTSNTADLINGKDVNSLSPDELINEMKIVLRVNDKPIENGTNNETSRALGHERAARASASEMVDPDKSKNIEKAAVSVTWNLDQVSFGKPGSYSIVGKLDDTEFLNPENITANYALTITEAEEVIFNDAGLKAVINHALDPKRQSDQAISREELLELRELDSSQHLEVLPTIPLKGTADFKFGISHGIKDLSGLEYASNLTKLVIAENEIKDLSPLSSLSSLEYLELDRNRITDVSPLSSLKQLKHLKLYNNLIEDISPLGNLNQLRYLDIHNNRKATGDEYKPIYSGGVKDISVIGKMPHLTELDISANQIEDAHLVYGLENLKHLTMSANQISDFSINPQFLSTRLAKMLNEGEGSVSFFGQKIPLMQTVMVDNDKTAHFNSPYKGIEELGKAIAHEFSLDQLNLFSQVSADIEGVEASYNPANQSFTLKLSEELYLKLNTQDIKISLKMEDPVTSELGSMFISEIILHKDKKPAQVEDVDKTKDESSATTDNAELNTDTSSKPELSSPKSTVQIQGYLPKTGDSSSMTILKLSAAICLAFISMAAGILNISLSNRRKS